MTRDDAPDRIWIEEDDGCPYFYDASELAEAGGPLIEYIRDDLATPAPVTAGAAGLETFQGRVQPWMQACFGPEISADRLERGDRLLEEVFELLQSGGYPRERVASLTGYVWSRPTGEPAQEVGGVMVTLAAYCLAHELDMHSAGETELARIWTKVEAIRAKQAAKPKGSALPQEWSTPAPVVPAEGPISTLEMVYRNMPDIPELPEAYQPRNIARSLAALRSAPPVGARVRPWETRPADPDAMIPATVEVHRGAWAVVIGTNGKPAGWIDTHDLFANQLYRDHILTTPAALLPAGEGEE